MHACSQSSQSIRHHIPVHRSFVLYTIRTLGTHTHTHTHRRHRTSTSALEAVAATERDGGTNTHARTHTMAGTSSVERQATLTSLRVHREVIGRRSSVVGRRRRRTRWRWVTTVAMTSDDGDLSSRARVVRGGDGGLGVRRMRAIKSDVGGVMRDTRARWRRDGDGRARC